MLIPIWFASFVSIFNLKLLQLEREPECQPNETVDVFAQLKVSWLPHKVWGI